MYAHSRPGAGRETWEPLADHLEEVGRRAAAFARSFGWMEAARAAGLLHDIGKASNAYQAYIAAPQEGASRGPDHSTAGAREAENLYGPYLGRMLAYAIAGHHGGLPDFRDLDRRVREKALEDCTRWREAVNNLPECAALVSRRSRPNVHPGFSEAFLIRMLFSCLVDADFLATERFYEQREREPPTDLALLQGRLMSRLAAMRRDNTELNRRRSEVLDHVLQKAGLEPGLFTLTTPTGGGKTLTSLAFALEHARLHGLKRVIYVIPYTSIIEQTAAVFREVLDAPEDVLEHHASFDWEPQRQSTEEADDEGRAGLTKLRRAAENWDAPIIVTTAVQFFESLFARSPSRCRKLHRIAESVVILDEAQTLPLRLLRPCMAALNELATNYRTSIVLCTATQPALRLCDGFSDVGRAPRARPKKVGFDIDDKRELAPDPKGLFESLKRVEVELRGKTGDDEVAARFAEQPQMLCIVNNRLHARRLFDRLKADPDVAEGVRHLTTLMCPAHRRAVLADVRTRLAGGRAVRLVATSLVEAGVDVDFPEVWRAITGLDSIAQAAGRCNREGRLVRGRTVVFEPADAAPPRDLEPLIAAAQSVFRRGLDPLSLEGVRAYFQEVYWLRGADAMDRAGTRRNPWSILQALEERVDGLEFEFETIARGFQLIDDDQATVIVPYDAPARTALSRVAAMDRPSGLDLRKLQQYAVSIPRRDRDAWLAAGILRPVNPRLGEALLAFRDLAHYRADTGVDLSERDWRDPLANIVGDAAT